MLPADVMLVPIVEREQREMTHAHAGCRIDRAAVAKKRAGERPNDALRP
jgi:hypothetical protein